jgi:hypothetical protein
MLLTHLLLVQLLQEWQFGVAEHLPAVSEQELSAHVSRFQAHEGRARRGAVADLWVCVFLLRWCLRFDKFTGTEAPMRSETTQTGKKGGLFKKKKKERGAKKK